MMIYETDDDLIVVDCGVLFPKSEHPGVSYLIPDVSYLRERREKLRAFVITHAHEDHIGALPFVLEELNAPIYATRFTLAQIKHKLSDYPNLEPRLEKISDRVPFQIGDFEIEPIPVTHSIPDSVALAIQTPAGKIIHTGDFKIDPKHLKLLDPELAKVSYKKGREKWIADGLRHTGITYRLEVVGDIGKVALWSGNSPAVIHDHYRDIVRGGRKQVEEFYAILPKA